VWSREVEEAEETAKSINNKSKLEDKDQIPNKRKAKKAANAKIPSKIRIRFRNNRPQKQAKVTTASFQQSKKKPPG